MGTFFRDRPSGGDLVSAIVASNTRFAADIFFTVNLRSLAARKTKLLRARSRKLWFHPLQGGKIPFLACVTCLIITSDSSQNFSSNSSYFAGESGLQI